MTRDDLITFRLGEPADIAFIYATWLRGLRHGNDAFAALPKGLFFSVYHAVIDRILLEPGCVVTVVCLRANPDTILGYSVVNHDTVHWVYIKKAWRGIGIVPLLMPLDVKKITHITKSALLHFGEDILKLLDPLKVPELRGKL